MLDIAPKGPFDIQYSFGSIVSSIVNILLVLIVVAFLFVILIGGITYITSSGEAEGKKKARLWFVNGFYGLLLAMFFWVLLYIGAAAMGLPGITHLEIPTISSISSGTYRGILDSIPDWGSGGSGEDPGDGGGGVGNCNCVLGGGGACDGNWAATGDVGPIGFNDICYICESGGWQSLGHGDCNPLNSCYSTCE